MKNDANDDPWIQTVSGKKFPLIEPDLKQIDIEDIAHALSMLCRFNGQCTRFYSVAEHSVHVSYVIDPEMALVGLLHDAAEAYLGDVPSPLKDHLTQFHEFEDNMEMAIGEKFGGEAAQFKCAELKRADVQLLVDEQKVAMVKPPEPWPDGAPSITNPDRIKCWPPEEAKTQYLRRFSELSSVQSGSFPTPPE